MNESYYISHGGKIPVKWTAPDVGHMKSVLDWGLHGYTFGLCTPSLFLCKKERIVHGAISEDLRVFLP